MIVVVTEMSHYCTDTVTFDADVHPHSPQCPRAPSALKMRAGIFFLLCEQM